MKTRMVTVSYAEETWDTHGMIEKDIELAFLYIYYVYNYKLYHMHFGSNIWFLPLFILQIFGSILCFSCEVWFSSYNFIELNYTKIRITAHLKSWKKNKLISCWASPILLDVKILDDNTNNVVLASKVYDSTMLSPLCIKLVLRNVHKLCVIFQNLE